MKVILLSEEDTDDIWNFYNKTGRKAFNKEQISKILNWYANWRVWGIKREGKIIAVALVYDLKFLGLIDFLAYEDKEAMTKILDHVEQLGYYWDCIKYNGYDNILADKGYKYGNKDMVKTIVKKVVEKQKESYYCDCV